MGSPRFYGVCCLAVGVQQPSHSFGLVRIRQGQPGDHQQGVSEARLDRLGLHFGGRPDSPHRSGIRPPFSSFRRLAGANAGANRRTTRRNV